MQTIQPQSLYIVVLIPGNQKILLVIISGVHGVEDFSTTGIVKFLRNSFAPQLKKIGIHRSLTLIVSS